MRRLILDRLQLQARVGILEHELLKPQALIVNIMVELPAAPLTPASDEISQVLDYRHLRNAAIEESAGGHHNLLETLAGRIVERLLAHPSVARVVVRIDKIEIFPDCDAVGVEIEAVKPAL
jgi:7,8-dihydroneopterin aldolase/epimerase/oxygenase